MKRKTIAQLEAELVSLRETSNSNYENGRKWRAQAEENEKALKESRSHFADLKERLANAEAETSRLNGYLARVHEDDVVRDGLVEIEDANGKRTVPKRQPPMMAVTHQVHTPSMFDEIDTYGRSKKRTHWTSY